MKLQKLVSNIREKQLIGNPDIEITEVATHSRKVVPGALFICIEGFRVDGHNYINEAIQSGAKAILISKDVPILPSITYIKVPDSKQVISTIADTFYNSPSSKLKLIGITGTNGKTTTAYLIESILNAANYKPARISTISYKIGESETPSVQTTPEALELQRILAQAVESAATHVVMEVSSHALALHRTSNCNFDTAIFTNISQEHLDFHLTMEDYLTSKIKLFKELASSSIAIINIDDEYAQEVISNTQAKIITYGLSDKAQIYASDIESNKNRTAFFLSGQPPTQINLKLIGLHNVYNALAAIAYGVVEQIDIQTIKEGVENLQKVRGRFELIDRGQNFTVVIDYAHTPDGLENVLLSSKKLNPKRIITVFGCGGDRDKEKRPQMGKVSTTLSDWTILTTDNPRTEDQEKIIKEIEAGVKGKSYEVIVDRTQAIIKALNYAKEGDLVLIAGKGHETYQIFKDKTIHFDDREVVEDILRHPNTRQPE
ncbi:MAG: UDP-N-acetylmuramoyl-L-alanyl-D-glutamate--2,6-diaminopimelate ligase [bacterium]